MGSAKDEVNHSPELTMWTERREASKWRKKTRQLGNNRESKTIKKQQIKGLERMEGRNGDLAYGSAIIIVQGNGEVKVARSDESEMLRPANMI